MHSSRKRDCAKHTHTVYNFTVIHWNFKKRSKKKSSAIQAEKDKERAEQKKKTTTNYYEKMTEVKKMKKPDLCAKLCMQPQQRQHKLRDESISTVKLQLSAAQKKSVKWWTIWLSNGVIIK